MSSKKFFTFDEAAAHIMEDSSDDDETVPSIIVLPPPSSEITDEEDFNDDYLLNDNENASINSTADVAGTLEIHEAQFLPPVILNKMKWRKTEAQYTKAPTDVEAAQIENLQASLGGKSCVEIFDLIFDSEVLNLLVSQTNLYASQQNRHDFSIKLAEMRSFLGFLLFTGYHKLPQERMYWSLDNDLTTPIVRSSLTQQTFRSIKRNLHLNNNDQLDTNDKLYKVKPYVDVLNKKFQQFGTVHHNISIDEQMIPYRGHHSCKMFIFGKPIKFGFKSWTLASSSGYVYGFEIYSGKGSNTAENNLGMGGNVVINLLKIIDDLPNHSIFFDNLFTSIPLLVYLREKNIFATGTLRENRLKDVGILNSKAFKKLERGHYDYRFEKHQEIMVIRWNDSAVVTVATNMHTVEPIVNVERYSKVKKCFVAFPQPNALDKYNKHMGGVDLADNCVSNYRIQIRGKKWWWPIFSNFLDVAASNAWKIFTIIHPEENINQLTFRRLIAVNFLRSTTVHSNLLGRRSNLFNNSRPGPVHLLIRTENRRRCRVCKSQTMFLCNLCNIYLHAKCIDLYHKNN
jgi:Transposase IS4